MKLDSKGYTLIELMGAMLILLLIMGVLASFLLGATKGATTARRSAWNGQAVERALTMVRQELAGTTSIQRDNDKLIYTRIRDNTSWTIMTEDGNLIRRNNDLHHDTVMMAKDVDTFEFILPIENLDEYGYSIDPKIIWIIVGAGNFKLDDAVYLRNYTE